MSTPKSISIFFISIATSISRILGLIREQIFAFLFGASNFADAFLVAFRIPNLLRDLFAEGALSTAFIPLFTDYLVNKGKKDAFYLANLVINFLIIAIGLIILIGYIFTPEIVKFIAPGFTKINDKFHITIIMTKILLPFLLFVSLASVFMGMLNAHKIFFLPSLAPALFNLILILTGTILIFSSFSNKSKIIIWSIGALIGGMSQLFIQIPFAYKKGYKYKFSCDLLLKHPGLKQIIRLILPATIGLAAVQINIIINTNLASLLATGSIAYLIYSFRLIQLPIGVFGVSIATVNTAYISHNIAKNEVEKLKKNIASSIKINSFLTLPSTFLLFFLGIPIIQLIFQHGKFLLKDTLLTYSALKYYSLSLFFYSGVKIFAPIFYALKKSYIPVLSSILAVITNISISLATYKIIGIKGLAIGLSSGSVVNFSFLLFMFFLNFGSLKGYKIFKSILFHFIASSISIALSYILYNSLINYSVLFKSIFPLLIAGVFYILLCYIMKINELSEFIKIFKKRIKR